MNNSSKLERERESRRDIFSFQNLLKAYCQCRKTKRKSASAAKFEINFEKNILELEKELKNKTYNPGQSVCFVITDPKIREVWAADFRDRVVHHLLVSCLEPIFEKKFIFHSFACRKGKGAHLAVRRLQKSIGKCAVPNYYLQIDILSFFVSIDKRKLFEIISKRVRNSGILWIAEKIIFHNPALNYRVNEKPEILKLIPKHKSLFNDPKNKGLPIGNLTSQFFANLYLNELDQFIKHKLKCRHFRYMDDLVLVCRSKEQLVSWRDEIKNFIGLELKLKLHPKKQILQTTDKGINFCGYIIKPDYKLIRRQTAGRLKRKLKIFNLKIFNSFDENAIFENRFSVFPQFIDDFQKIFNSLNSTYGFFKHANCYHLRKSIYEKHFGILKIYLLPANRNFDYFQWNEPYPGSSTSVVEVELPSEIYLGNY